MPELPPPKFTRPTPTPVAGRPAGTAYAELHCRSNFSFLEGASHPDELVERAAELGHAALAITDRNSLAGVVRAHVAAKEVGLKLLIGAEITPHDAPPVVLLATDRAAYGRLSRLITRGRRRAGKGECDLSFDDVAEHAEGLIACVLVEGGGATPGRRLGDVFRFRDLFGDRCHLLAERHLGADDDHRLQRLLDLSRETRVPLVAANDVHYHVPARQPLHDVVTAIRHRCPVAELGHRRFPNAERHLKSPDAMAALFAACPEAVERTVAIADRCTFSLDELRYEYPVELSPPGQTPLAYLVELTWRGARDRYPDGVPDDVRGRIEHELRLIEQLHYEAYFLTVWDLVRFARSRRILCQGRGSAANSAVCYCLGVTAVDPSKHDLLFERFVSAERNEPPDIDVDFEHERREEVIQYVYEKYGRDRAGMTATVISYRPKSAIRDVGKALGFSLDTVDRLAGAVEHFTDEDHFATRVREAGLDPTARTARQFLHLVRELLGFPRHLSQHTGGMVMTNGRLDELVPVENAAMPDRTVVQWDKDDLDAMGLLKVDCLALGMLTAIRKAFDCGLRIADCGTLQSAIRNPKSEIPNPIDALARVPPEDPAVYEMIQRADTIGVFQIESRAQMSMLPRLRPERFYDLVIEVAIVRPGPIQGDMVHPYLRRRNKEEPVEYPDDRVKAVLERTLGVPIFQEQAMKLAVVAAGFTPGEADQLRRAMAAWRRNGNLERFRAKLVDGMAANGYDPEFAERVYNQIKGFGEYGFPESHAASFALLVYVSAWLKRRHPAAFCCAILNSQPMGFYAPSQLVRDAREHGVEVRPADVNASEWDCTLEDCGFRISECGMDGGNPQSEIPNPQSLRLGFRMITGFSEADAERIVAARADGPFVTVDEFAHRTGLSSTVVARLARADAFASLDVDRRTALWESLPIASTPRLLDELPYEEPEADLPVMSEFDEVAADYRATSLSLKAHPFSFVRGQLDRMGVLRAEELEAAPDDRRQAVAGLVLLRQRPQTAKGITFVTLEDETGTANLVVHPGTWERYRRVARHAAVMLARGRLQREGRVIHLVVEELRDLGEMLAHVESRSRDFR